MCVISHKRHNIPVSLSSYIKLFWDADLFKLNMIILIKQIGSRQLRLPRSCCIEHFGLRWLTLCHMDKVGGWIPWGQNVMRFPGTLWWHHDNCEFSLHYGFDSLDTFPATIRWRGDWLLPEFAPWVPDGWGQGLASQNWLLSKIMGNWKRIHSLSLWNS